MKRALLVVAFGLAAAGCVHTQRADTGSWAKGINAEDANLLATEILSVLKVEAPPGPTVALVVERPAESDALTPILGARLVAAGYAVAEPGQPVHDGAVRVRYAAVPMQGGVLLRLEVGQVLASRWFTRAAGGAGALVASSPVAIGRWP